MANPTDLVKVQMQMEGRRRLLGEPPRVHGTVDAFRRIFREGGVRGLWNGWAPNIQRAALVNMGDLTTYDVGASSKRRAALPHLQAVKQQLLTNTDLGDTPVVHAISSGCAGVAAAVIGTPAGQSQCSEVCWPACLSRVIDVIKTRIMNQPTKDGRCMFRCMLYLS